MGFERESFDKLMKVVWGKKSQMQQAMSRDSKGEPFIIRELEFKGAQTPSQLATALKAAPTDAATSGVRVSCNPRRVPVAARTTNIPTRPGAEARR